MSRNPVLKPGENEDEQLKIANLMELEDILKDQKENPNMDKFSLTSQMKKISSFYTAINLIKNILKIEVFKTIRQLGLTFHIHVFCLLAKLETKLTSSAIGYLHGIASCRCAEEQPVYLEKRFITVGRCAF